MAIFTPLSISLWLPRPPILLERRFVSPCVSAVTDHSSWPASGRLHSPSHDWSGDRMPWTPSLSPWLRKKASSNGFMSWRCKDREKGEWEGEKGVGCYGKERFILLRTSTVQEILAICRHQTLCPLCPSPCSYSKKCIYITGQHKQPFLPCIHLFIYLFILNCIHAHKCILSWTNTTSLLKISINLTN